MENGRRPLERHDVDDDAVGLLPFIMWNTYPASPWNHLSLKSEPLHFIASTCARTATAGTLHAGDNGQDWEPHVLVGERR
jgi:hypothetical protein